MIENKVIQRSISISVNQLLFLFIIFVFIIKNKLYTIWNKHNSLKYIWTFPKFLWPNSKNKIKYFKKVSLFNLVSCF